MPPQNTCIKCTILYIYIFLKKNSEKVRLAFYISFQPGGYHVQIGRERAAEDQVCALRDCFDGAQPLTPVVALLAGVDDVLRHWRATLVLQRPELKAAAEGTDPRPVVCARKRYRCLQFTLDVFRTLQPLTCAPDEQRHDVCLRHGDIDVGAWQHRANLAERSDL